MLLTSFVAFLSLSSVLAAPAQSQLDKDWAAISYKAEARQLCKAYLPRRTVTKTPGKTVTAFGTTTVSKPTGTTIVYTKTSTLTKNAVVTQTAQRATTITEFTSTSTATVTQTSTTSMLVCLPPIIQVGKRDNVIEARATNALNAAQVFNKIKAQDPNYLTNKCIGLVGSGYTSTIVPTTTVNARKTVTVNGGVATRTATGARAAYTTKTSTKTVTQVNTATVRTVKPTTVTTTRTVCAAIVNLPL
ncbi:hypothetical protein OIO90_003341 [Microbotryomycetes sp. JL221]|nr:hypothetical protein OIO90_003341 [Microbotryomycetes sp. JL221]